MKIGDKIGKLTVKETAKPGRAGAKMWLCECDCGNTVVASESTLLNGGIHSCGCMYQGMDDPFLYFRF